MFVYVKMLWRCFSTFEGAVDVFVLYCDLIKNGVCLREEAVDVLIYVKRPWRSLFKLRGHGGVCLRE